MGDPVNEYEAGLDCEKCWGPGKTFGDKPTPLRMFITGSGFVPPVEGANDTWILTQDAVNPCYWDGQNNGFIGYFEFDAMNSRCEIKHGAQSIFLAVDVPCILEFDDGAKHVSLSGEGSPMTPEWRYAKVLGISPSDRTWHEDYPKDGPTEVLRLANKLDRICVYVEYTPEY